MMWDDVTIDSSGQGGIVVTRTILFGGKWEQVEKRIS